MTHVAGRRRFGVVALLALVAALPCAGFDAAARSRVTSARVPAFDGPELLLELPWGSGGAFVGRDDGDESAPEGPMSFALGPEGEILVLDQLSSRVVVFGRDGALRRELPLPGTTFQELELLPDGRLLALDRLALASIFVLSPSGAVQAEHPVVGAGVPEGGAITAMLVLGDGVWLEVAHEHSVRVLDPSLRRCERVVVSGRPSSDGALSIGAALDGRGGARIWRALRSSREVVASAEVRFGHPMARIVWLQEDGSGGLLGVYHLLEYDRQDFTRIVHEEVVGVGYDGALRPTAELRSPLAIRVWEQFREVRVGRDGEVVQMAFTEGGVLFLRWRRRP